MNEQAFVTRVIENKTITWFENTNEYLILEHITADILKRIARKDTINEIALAVSKKISVPYEKAVDFIINLKKDIYDTKTIVTTEYHNDYRDIQKPKKFEFTKHYQFGNTVIAVNYQTLYELDLIHPKFEHIAIDATTDANALFEVFTQHSFTFLMINNQLINAWHRNDIHYFQGKFSMEIIQKMYQKKESEWLGVFHASAVGNGKKSILFLGDSGNGKSTSLALLQAHDFDCLADDFVPVLASNRNVYSFDAGISIKKNSVDALLPYYPELANAEEYHFKSLNKIVKYLPPKSNSLRPLPCNTLVFIKYNKDIDLQCEEISKLKAFEKLVPDSWLSPIKENAIEFLDWFQSLKCYELQYSINEKMIAKVHQLFDE